MCDRESKYYNVYHYHLGTCIAQMAIACHGHTLNPDIYPWMRDRSVELFTTAFPKLDLISCVC